MNHVDVPLCVSSEVAAEMYHLYGLKKEVLVITNGVDTEKFKPSFQENIFDEYKNSGITVGTVSRLDKGKGLDRLIADFVKYCIAGELVIVGDGPEKRKLEYIIEQYGAIDRIKLLGHLDDIPKVLNSFDVFVLPSFSEGLSNVLLEAMSCGLPIVAYDIGGNRELVHREGGILVDLQEDGALIKAVNTLIADKNKRENFGAYNRELAVNKFSLVGMIEEYAKLYNN